MKQLLQSPYLTCFAKVHIPAEVLTGLLITLSLGLAALRTHRFPTWHVLHNAVDQGGPPDTPLAKDKEPQEELEGMLQGMQIFLNTQQQSPLVGPHPDLSVPSRVAQASVQGQGDLQKEGESSGSAARKPAGAAGGRAAPRGRSRFPRAVLPSLCWAFVTSPRCLRI